MPTTIYCQFASSDCDKIVSVFAGPQDPNVFSNLGEVLSDDSRYVEFYIAQWELVQRNMIKPGD